MYPWIAPVKDFDDKSKINKLVENLLKEWKEETNILFLLIFIAAVEDDADLTKVIRQKTKDFQGNEYDLLNKEDPFLIVTTDLNILDSAFQYALETRNIAFIRYILEGAERCFINASIHDDQILMLLENIKNETNQQILRLLTTKDIILLNEYGEAENSPGLQGFVDVAHSNKSFLADVSNYKQINASNSNLLDKPISSRSKKPKRKSDLKVKKKKNPFNKFLQKADIIEIAIRAPNISDDEEVFTITVLYDQLSIPTNETVSLYKLLIYYEQLQTFEMLLKQNMKGNKTQYRDQLALSRDETQNEIVLGRKDDDNVYDYDEIVSDAFSYAITLNKLHIAFYLFKTYEEDVYGNKMLCVKSILDSFKNDDTQINQVMYLEERLYILEKFMKFIEYKLALEFLTVIHQEITDKPQINFLVYCSNPLKIIAMFLNIVIHLGKRHQNLKFKAQKVRAVLCDIANGVINTSNGMNEVKDLLLDKTYNGSEVIDLIEMLDVIEILQNPMIDSIVSNMYYGPYERESFMKKSTLFKVLEEQTNNTPGEDLLVSRSFRLIGTNHRFHSFKKYFEAQTKPIQDFGKDKKLEFYSGSTFQSSIKLNDDGENSNKMVGHIFQYQIWKKSLDVSYYIYVFLVILMAVLLHYFSFELIQQQIEVISQKEEIDALKELPETPTTLAALEVAYKEQSNLSESYYEYLRVVISLHIITIGYLLQNIYEIIYASLRKVHVKTFTLSVLLNITSTIVIFVWIIKHFGDYATEIDHYRVEERASIIISRMNNDSDFNLKKVLAILLAIQYTRLVLSLQVSRTFGPMVKILASMLVNVLIFLVLYTAMFFIFVGAGQLLFAELDTYRELDDAMKTLFASSIGEFDYSTYDDLKDVEPYVGHMFITVFLIVISIILLNFLIAILSNTYELLNGVKNGLYLKKVINLRQKYNYNDTYSSIVYAGPPFNIFIAFYLPFIVYCKSKKLNKVFLVIEYVGIAVFGVLAFFTISLVLCAPTYLLLLFDRLKKLPQKPFVNKADFWLRLLDLVAFLFVGMFLVLFWVGLDTIVFAVQLFSDNIMYIDEYEGDAKHKINKIMDGSLKKPDEFWNIGNLSKLAAVAQQKQFIRKSTTRNSNPIKEGLSETTLNILKASLKTMKDDHIANLDKLKKSNEVKHSFIPTVSVLEEMRTNLLVLEQINIILFGVTYQKKEDFFISDKFDALVESLTFNQNLEEIRMGDAAESSVNSSRANLFCLRREKTMTHNIVQERSQFWEQKLKDFLLKSNEKWLLDQFNLCKRFLNQNSIEGHLDDFKHPVFENFKHIRSLKGKLAQSYTRTDSDITRNRTIDKDELAKNIKDEEHRVPSFEDYNVKIMKCDISALLKVIEEIENRLKMEKILNKRQSKDKDQEQQDENEEDVKAKVIRQQFSMVNFNRNYLAIKYAQENPSNNTNKLSLY